MPDPNQPEPVRPPGAVKKYREVTISAIIFGVIVGAIMNAAITYAGLKIGFTIVGSSIAAVLGFGVLRYMLRRGTILETNIGQTIASAVNTPNSGVIFTVPVLLLLGYSLSPLQANFWLITLACVAGAILGGAFIVPLRKQMLDIERLRFPSATAVGAILKSPGAGAKKAVILILGVVIAALIYLPTGLPAIRTAVDAEPAETLDDRLSELVYNEKISFEDKLRTLMLDRWARDQAVPEPVLEHGRILEQVRDKRAELDEATDVDEKLRLGEELSDLETRAEEAKQTAIAVIEQQTRRGAHAVSDYKDSLAERALAADRGDAEWADLRDRLLGWATKPLWGYSDLNIRLPRTVDDDAEPVDYAYNGLGDEDPVLEQRVDQDRNGRADLIVEDDRIDLGRWLGVPVQMQLIFAIAPFALGAGYLTGRAGLFVLAGGVLAYHILNPILFAAGWMPATVSAAEAAEWGHNEINRPLGIGLLLGGALMGIVASLPAIKEALKSIAAASKAKSVGDELGLKVLVVAVIISTILLFLAADFMHGVPINQIDPVSEVQIDEPVETIQHNGYTIGFASESSLQTWNDQWSPQQRAAFMDTMSAKPGLLAPLNSHLRSLIIALIGAAWIWFAGIIIAQCTGMTDWSPISGMALLTVVLVLVLAGTGEVLGAVLIGAALCVAITCAADMMADLRTGYIVGSTPKKQQTWELISTGLGPLITMGVILLIAETNRRTVGVPLGPGTDTVAPQAQALEAVIIGVQGGEMPYALYGFGALLGGLLGLGAFSGLGVLVGLSMYLPFIYIATYGIGCLINIGVAKIKGRTWAEEWGVPLAAGFIVGDALLALSINFIVLLRG